MHADLNGAYNIGRKACPQFAFGPGLSLAVRIRTHVDTPEVKGWRPVSPRLRPRRPVLAP